MHIYLTSLTLCHEHFVRSSPLVQVLKRENHPTQAIPTIDYGVDWVTDAIPDTA